MPAKRSAHHTILTALFLLCLALPFVWSLPWVGVFDRAAFMFAERRLPAEYPKAPTKLGDIADFPERFEKAFNDRFGFRQIMIDTYKWLMFATFNVATDNQSVIVGKNGWLFLGNAACRVVDQHSGVLTPDRRAINSFVQNELRKRAWLARRGIEYLFFIAPDKHSIYPEMLPDYIHPKSKNGFGDEFVLAAKQNGLSILDVREKLCQAKTTSDRLLYSPAGTHWTFVGAYHAYLELIKSLSDQMRVPLTAIRVKSFALDNKARVGELARLSGIFCFLDVSYRPVIGSPYHDLDVISLSDGSSIEWRPLQPVNHTTYVTVKNRGVTDDIPVLVIRDSFFTAVSLFFSQTFSEVSYVHYRSELVKNNLADLMLKTKPRVVVFEMVERWLPWASTLKYAAWLAPNINDEEARLLWPTLTPGLDAGQLTTLRKVGDVAADGQGRLDVAPAPKGAQIVFGLPKSSEEWLVRLDIDAPADGPLRLSYATTAQPLLHKNPVQHRGLKKGPNLLFVEIRDASEINQLGIYLGPAAGRYRLNALELRHVPEAALCGLYRPERRAKN